MPLRVVRYETTPNPNALKVWLDARISEVPRSFLTRQAASGDGLAEALFDEAGATTLLFFGDWLTFNKDPDETWPKVKRRIEAVLRAHGGEEE